jgi:1,4-dihydroxy-2-naphthoate octaprenyltransferase
MENHEALIVERLLPEKKIMLASYPDGEWKTEAVAAARGMEVYCVLSDKSVYAGIKKNPRVDFTGAGVSGRGIAREIKAQRLPEGINIQPGNYIFLLVPYRIKFNGGEFEKTKKGWIPAAAEVKRDRGLKFWLDAARFVSAPMSLIPVITGTLLAAINGKFNPFIFLAALAGGLAAHMGVNFYSDYNDYKKGFDTPGALSSHTGALIDERIAPSAIITAAFICFAVTGFSGLYLIFAAGWPVIIFGFIGLAGGVSYTGWPLAAKYRAMGELATSFLMGPLMVAGAYFVQAGNLRPGPVVISVCLGLLVGSVTLANNIRDMEDDGNNGFVTLPIKTGFGPARKIYAAFLLAPYAVLSVFIAIWPKFYPAAAAFFSLPYAVKCISLIFKGGKNSAEIRLSAVNNPYPLFSIRLYIRFSMLLLAGLCAVFFLR